MSEVVFELSALQHELMGYPLLRQGQALDVVLDAGLLFPEADAASWYFVRPDELPPAFMQVTRGRYAFSGQIRDAEIVKADNESEATLLVDCGVVPIRVVCASQEDGTLPWGTWETRYLAGYGPLQGIVEDDFRTAIGQSIGLTIWNFHRLVLKPGDPLFGQWFESDELPGSPLGYDRLFITARRHQQRF